MEKVKNKKTILFRSALLSKSSQVSVRKIWKRNVPFSSQNDR